MCQFIPLRAAAQFAADKMQFIQRIDSVVTQAFGLRFTPKHHSPCTSRSDQMLFEPGSQNWLGNVGLLRDGLDRLLIETQEGLFHADCLEMRDGDLRIFGLQVAPESLADDLKLD